MPNDRQRQASYGFLSELVTVTALLLVSPLILLACVPLALFMLPVAAVALPFIIAAFFGQTKALRPVQPVVQLRPRLAVLQ